MQTTDLVSQFLGECGVRGLSPATVEQYNWAFSRLLAHCPEMPDSGQELLPVLQGSLELAPESRRDLLKCLRTFFRWAERRHHLPNPCGEVDPLPRPRRQPGYRPPADGHLMPSNRYGCWCRFRRRLQRLGRSAGPQRLPGGAGEPGLR